MKPPHIGTLNEGSLHDALKRHYARAGDAFEVPVDGFVVDILRDPGGPDELVIEVQTGGFGAMGRKLDHLLETHRVLMVHPIAVRTRLERSGHRPRWSPKRGTIHDVFDELVSIPTLVDHPNFVLHVALVEVTRVEVHDPRARRGRGGYRTVDRRLDNLVSVAEIADTHEVERLLPTDVTSPFTTADLALGAGVDRRLAQKMAYCAHALGLVVEVGRDRAGRHYRWTQRTRP